MPIVKISNIDEPGVSVYHQLTDHQLRNRLHPDCGVIIVESPKVIRVALQSGLQPLSLLCEAKHITGDAADIVAQVGDIPIYTGSREPAGPTHRLHAYAWRAVRHETASAGEPRHDMQGKPQIGGYRQCSGHDQHWCHLSLGCRIGNRWSFTYANLMRPVQPQGYTRIDGICFSVAMDMARQTYRQPARLWFQNCCHGASPRQHHLG